MSLDLIVGTRNGYFKCIAILCRLVSVDERVEGEEKGRKEEGNV